MAKRGILRLGYSSLRSTGILGIWLGLGIHQGHCGIVPSIPGKAETMDITLASKNAGQKYNMATSNMAVCVLPYYGMTTFFYNEASFNVKAWPYIV